LNTTEETAAPITVAGPHSIAFAIGPEPHQTVAIADTSNGRISGRIAPGKGEIVSLAATPDGKTIYFAAGHTALARPPTPGGARRRWRGPQAPRRRRCPDRPLGPWTGNRPPRKFAHHTLAYDARRRFRTADPHRRRSAATGSLSLAGRNSPRWADAGFVESA